jgi:putative restriction endonuclease
MKNYSEDDQSAAIRKAAFDWLKHLTDFQGDVLPRILLEQGFQCGDQNVRVIGPQGIFKPAQLSYYPLSITTTTNGPYKDAFAPGGDLLLYRYRGTDPNFHENRRLRDAMRNRIPLIYFHGTVPGKYLAVWPVYVVGDNPGQLTFTVSVDDPVHLSYERDDTDDEVRRGYITRQVDNGFISAHSVIGFWLLIEASALFVG